jgi:hypothetical protein
MFAHKTVLCQSYLPNSLKTSRVSTKGQAILRDIRKKGEQDFVPLPLIDCAGETLVKFLDFVYCHHLTAALFISTRIQ